VHRRVRIPESILLDTAPLTSARHISGWAARNKRSSFLAAHLCIEDP
jgi:hypothetical protein